MEIIQKIADLEQERDWETKKLKKKNCQTIWVGRKHVSIRDVKLRLISNILNKSELLKTDNQGEPIYPNRGMPKSRYFPKSNGLTKRLCCWKKYSLLLKACWSCFWYHYLLVNKSLCLRKHNWSSSRILMSWSHISQLGRR